MLQWYRSSNWLVQNQTIQWQKINHSCKTGLCNCKNLRSKQCAICVIAPQNGANGDCNHEVIAVLEHTDCNHPRAGVPLHRSSSGQECHLCGLWCCRQFFFAYLARAILYFYTFTRYYFHIHTLLQCIDYGIMCVCHYSAAKKLLHHIGIVTSHMNHEILVHS